MVIEQVVELVVVYESMQLEHLLQVEVEMVAQGQAYHLNLVVVMPVLAIEVLVEGAEVNLPSSEGLGSLRWVI